MRMGIVAHDFKILELVVEDRSGFTFDHQFGKRSRLPRQLELGLLDVVL